MKTVTIFGGSGFIGKNIVRRLSKKNWKIYIPYQYSISIEPKLRLFGKVGQITPIKFNNLAEQEIHNIVKNSDVIINLKTIWKENKFFSFNKNILIFNKDLVDLINSFNSEKKYIFFSGLGTSEKSPSKRVRIIAKTEKYIAKNIENFSIIRPSIVLGSGDQFLTKLLPIIKLSFFIPLFGSGNAKVQPLFVEDVAKGIEAILEKRAKNSSYYDFAGTNVFSYKSIYSLIIQILKLKRIFVPLPFKLLSFLAFFIEKLPINLITREQLILFKQDNIILKTDNKKLEDLGIFSNDIKIVIKNIVKY